MGSFRSAFPSKFLKSEDLNGKPLVGTIASVDLETVGQGEKQEEKWVVRFVEPTLKALVLNMINCETIAEIVGNDDVIGWPGAVIELFPTRTEFAGKRVPCIRVRPPSKANRPAPAGRAPARPATAAPDDIDEAIPTTSVEY